MAEWGDCKNATNVSVALLDKKLVLNANKSRTNISQALIKAYQNEFKEMDRNNDGLITRADMIHYY